MQIPIQAGRIKYIVNKDNKTVTAVIRNCAEDLVSYLDRNQFILSTRDKKFLTLKKAYLGVAKCSENDEFNIEIGKTIASKRAAKSYREAVMCVYSNWVREKVKKFNLTSFYLQDDVKVCQGNYRVMMYSLAHPGIREE